MFFLILLPAPLFSGLEITSMFIINSLILVVFILKCFECCALGKVTLWNYKFFTFSLCVFILFIVFVFVQWALGLEVFTKLLPGSVQPFSTKDNAIQLLLYFIFFLLCLDFFSDRKKVSLAASLFALQVLFLMGLGFYQNFFDLKAIYGLYHAPPPAPFYSSFLIDNHYGVYLALVCPLFLASIVYYYQKENLENRSDLRLIQNIFYLVLLAAMAASIFNAEARAGFVIHLAVFCIFLMASASKKFLKNAVILLVMLGALMLVALNFFSPQLLWQTYSALPQSLSERFAITRDACLIYSHYPLFGTGFGTYQWFYKIYQMTNASYLFSSHAFNDHLELLGECGTVGYLLFVVPIATLSLFSLKKCLKSSSFWCRSMGLAAFIAVGFLCGASFFDYYLKTPAIAMLFAMYLAILLRCATFYSEFRHEVDWHLLARTDLISRLLKGLLVVSVGVALIFLFNYLTRNYLSQKVYNRIEDSQRYDAKKNLTPKLTELMMTDELGDLEKAVDSAPLNPKGWSLLGGLYYDLSETSSTEESKSLLNKSVDAYDLATELAPTFSDYWLSLGRAKIRTGKTMDGLEDMRHGAELAPFSRDVILYAILIHLKVEEYALWESDKHEIHSKALALVRSTLSLPDPLTKEDHDYLNHRYRYWQKRMTPADDAKILGLIEELNLSS